MENWPEILNDLNIEQNSNFESFDVFLNERDKPRKIEIMEIVIGKKTEHDIMLDKFRSLFQTSDNYLECLRKKHYCKWD